MKFLILYTIRMEVLSLFSVDIFVLYFVKKALYFFKFYSILPNSNSLAGPFIFSW